MEISIYNPDYVPGTLAEFVTANTIPAAEVIDIVTTLNNNNIYYGGGGAAAVWAVKQREPNDAIFKLDLQERVLFECAAPVEEECRSDPEIIEDAMHAAIDAGAKVIMDYLGVTDGGYASIHFSGGEDTDTIQDIFKRFLVDQRRHEEASDAPIQGKDPFGLDQFPLNTVVRFKADYDQFPETVVKAGETGTVIVIDENEPIGTVMLSIELDRFHNSLLEWKNQVHVTIEKGEDIHAILERVS